MPISRRQFGATVAAGITTAGTIFADDSRPQTLRVIAYNIFNLTGWPHQRRLAQQAVAKGQMAKRLAMELSLHEPDIISFSESPGEELTKEVAALLGMNHVRFPSGGSWPGTLLSKFEIIESQNAPVQSERPKELFTRHWGSATVKLPSGDPLVVHSAHLYVMAAGPIAERVTESRPLFEGAFRLNINDKESFALSDHLPQLAVFEWK
ncbi:hypothetical protein Mal15_23200 [Stieleria maiorica]|uniref:Endonuclease/Exonuclease/phosphatase family protein n=2 Tax=Stieleria maiorica TaxID=2795974 RepID=A0A5B9ME68_9BACT|nr:hypothetical protein Mal15_23200 [Stieleria maiorica]